MNKQTNTCIFRRVTSVGVLCIALLGSVVFLTGCSPEPDTQLKKVSPASDSARFSIERVGVIDDDLAYDSLRGIYVVTDKQTGRQYIGLSGVGISELGSHAQSTGKRTIMIPDER